jgi:hypothetical protein
MVKLCVAVLVKGLQKSEKVASPLQKADYFDLVQEDPDQVSRLAA